MKIVIFLGPTMPVEDARAILPNAVYLPPAGQSDLLSALTTEKPDVIGLIDGVFSQSLSVWHKEILYALQQGVYVYGASSMGALRATETDTFGMIGIGKIYESYRSGQLTDDDEVALAHSAVEDGYKNLSEPLVNLRATFGLALERGVITAETHQLLIDSAKSLFFPERGLPAIYRKATLSGLAPEVVPIIQEFVASNYVNLKRLDAIQLLETLRDLPADLPPFVADFQFNHSHLFSALYDRDRTVQRPAGSVSFDAISTYVSLHHPDFLAVNANVLNRELALVLAEMLEVEVTEQQTAAEVRRFRVRLGLRSKAQFEAWRDANDISAAEFDTLMHESAICRRMHRWLISRLHLRSTTRLLLNGLRLQNEYTTWADQAAQQEKILAETQPRFLQTDHSHLAVETLLMEHLRATGCQIDTGFEIWLEEAGFDDTNHLWLELLRAKLAREAQPSSVPNADISSAPVAIS